MGRQILSFFPVQNVLQNCSKVIYFFPALACQIRKVVVRRVQSVKNESVVSGVEVVNTNA